MSTVSAGSNSQYRLVSSGGALLMMSGNCKPSRMKRAPLKTTVSVDHSDITWMRAETDRWRKMPEVPMSRPAVTAARMPEAPTCSEMR